MVELIAQRSEYVRQAAKFKTTTAEVEAPRRVEQVIEKVRRLAHFADTEPDIVEQTYRAMITGFIALEKKEHGTIT